jgi:succinate dehydrogenase / fumarate reductase membrane anchor subunit
MGAPLVKSKKFGLKHPLARARGLGSAHEGLHHWISQRVTAVLLLPLTVWLCWSMVGIAHMDHATFVAWLSQPWNTILMVLTVGTMFYHAVLGNQVVIEDYIHTEGLMIAKMLAMRFVYLIAGIACIYAILKVAL